MSGTVKSGLLLGIIGAIGGVIFSLPDFIPRGALFYGPAIAPIIGGIAGYLGVRWSNPDTQISKGIVAGTVAGLGLLLGALIAWIALFNVVRTMPQFHENVQQVIAQNPQTNQFSPEQIEVIIMLAGPSAGLCFGTFELVVALGFGALGGWLAKRTRRSKPPTP